MDKVIDKVLPVLKTHEGFSDKPYLDTVGKLTIGYGRNLDDVGISKEEAEYLLRRDASNAYQDAHMALDCFDELNDARKAAITNMMFNLGYNRFTGFKKMIAALNNHDYDTAAHEMLDSKWAVQVKGRANYLAEQIRSGV